MKYLDVFNVKHGDFGVYHDLSGNYLCLLDCGSTQLNSGLHTACLTPQEIIDSVVTCKITSPSIIDWLSFKNILISHYHEDHFNGLGILKAKKSGPFFETMYLPFIDFKKKYAGQLLYSLCLLQGASDALNIKYTQLENFSSLFLDNYAKQRTFLCRGDNINAIKDNGHNVAEVLWPPKGIDGESKELQKFIKRLKDSLHKHNLELAIKKTDKYFSELKSKMSSQKIHDSDNIVQSEVDINEIFGIEDVKRKKNRKNRDRQEVIDAFDELKNVIKGFLNALSIVFKVGSKLLWMGDITEKVLEILKSDLQGDIEYFKLPHHGTIDISTVPVKASKFIVSLADGRNYKSLHKNNIRKALNDGTFISCTDGHRDCHNGFPFVYPISCLSILCQNTHCSQNTIVRITL